jgi:hypothetical protein
MAAAAFSGTDEERAEQALIAAAVKKRLPAEPPGGFRRPAVCLRGA